MRALLHIQSSQTRSKHATNYTVTNLTRLKTWRSAHGRPTDYLCSAWIAQLDHSNFRRWGRYFSERTETVHLETNRVSN